MQLWSSHIIPSVFNQGAVNMPPAIPGRQCHICQTIPHRASRWAPGGGSHACKMQDDCVSGEPMAAVHKIHPRSQPHFTTKWIPVGIRLVTLGQHFVDYNPAALGWLYYMLGCPCFFLLQTAWSLNKSIYLDLPKSSWNHYHLYFVLSLQQCKQSLNFVMLSSVSISVNECHLVFIRSIRII